jgi:hypothetical protein
LNSKNGFRWNDFPCRQQRMHHIAAEEAVVSHRLRPRSPATQPPRNPEQPDRQTGGRRRRIRRRPPHRQRVAPTPSDLEKGGTVENARAIAAHESPRTTKLYDRTSDEISLDEIERIVI